MHAETLTSKCNIDAAADDFPFVFRYKQPSHALPEIRVPKFFLIGVVAYHEVPLNRKLPKHSIELLQFGLSRGVFDYDAFALCLTDTRACLLGQRAKVLLWTVDCRQIDPRQISG